MVDSDEKPLSDKEMAEIRDMLDCSRPAGFILWEDEDQAQAEISDSGVPCGTQLPPRGLTRGWEVCERCVKNPLLKCALFIGAKEGSAAR